MRRLGRRSGLIESLQMVAVAALIAATVPQSAAAQNRSLADRWVVDGGELYCSLSRTPGINPLSFTVRLVPGTGDVQLLVSSDRWNLSPLSAGDAVTVILDPGEARFETTALTGRAAGGDRVVAFFGLPEFLETFAKASSLRVLRDRHEVLSARFTSASRAVETLRACVDDAYQRWGTDAPALRALRQRPRAVDAQSWLSGNDYPRRSMQEDAQGTVVARLRVSAEGRVTDCAVVRSSGDRALDQRTCEAALTRGRYHPAIDAEGRPVAALIPVVVRWRISGG